MHYDLWWTGWNKSGLEHCRVMQTSESLILEGLSVGARETQHGAQYRVRCDDQARTREVRLSYLGGAQMHVLADGEGHWTDAFTSQPIPELAGCIDVDIGVTPATNALPIKRLGLEEGASAEIRAAYVPLSHQIEGRFLPHPAEQRYTCLTPGKCYRYEGLFRGFSAELWLDEAGFVMDYPETFRRHRPIAQAPHP